MIVTTRAVTMKLLLHALSLLLVLLAVEASVPRKQPGTCEPISAKICASSDVFHKVTSTPITVRDGPGGGVTEYNNQKKSLHQMRPYVSLLRSGKECKKFLKPFACAVHLPACDDSQMMRPIPPCKELCYQAKQNCNEGFANLGLEWPRALDCSLFPSSLEDPQCISAYRVSVDDTVVESQAEVQVTCSYSAKPRMQPKWVKNGAPVAEISGQIRTEMAGGHTTTLIIEDFTDIANRGVYTCVVENDNFGSSVNLDNIFGSEDGGMLPGGDTPSGQCPPGTFPCAMSEDICIPPTALCDGIRDCPNGMDEMQDCPGSDPFPSQTCESFEVPCPSGDKCVPFSAVCDGVNDCPSGMDESDCTGGNPFPSQTCQPFEVPCPSGDKCVPFTSLCDGIQDCPSGMDEKNCTGGNPFPSQTCESFEVPCPSGDKCVPFSAVCDGVRDCPSGMDESDCTGGNPFPSQTCESFEVPCPSGDKCVPFSAVCDGVNDCPSGMDESDCTGGSDTSDGQCPPGTLLCPMSGDVCIPLTALCDGNNDCPDGMDEMMNCTTSVETCVPITLPECMIGLDYTTTMPNYPPGLSNSDKLSMLSSLSPIFNSTCGRFFRPFMCSAFLPPCRERVVPPCRELCFLAVKKCLETFEGILSEEDLMASGGSGGSCDMMPSEADGQCYNVKGVSIGDVIGMGSEAGVSKSVDCTHNLMPGVQPMWTDPNGKVIRTGSRRRVQAIYASGTVTRLQIDNYTRRYGGTYTCSADGFTATAEL